MNLILNHEGYEDHLLHKKISKEHNAAQYVFKFKNNYGASVIKNKWSYGYKEDLWELAIVTFIDEDDAFEICDQTPITNDVLGCLTNAEVKYLLGKIKEL